ncbi:MAG: peptide chain release factor N(5)-glutamine methyltransferase [Bacteroidia bacterium]
MLISKNQLKQIVYDTIPHFYSIEERESLVKNFICEILEIPVTYYLLQKEFELSEAQIISYTSALENLSKGQPLQYIVGKTFFYGREFLVNSKVLIPRPETEELCQWIIEDTLLNNPSILDIGCGSGNIPITLEQEIKNSNVFAIDISTDALGVAQENSKLNNSNVQFEQMDILNWRNTNKFLKNKFDVIVSNPPYILEEEKILMRKNVLDFEPHVALFVKQNPMLFYDTIAEFAKKHLNRNGKLFFEINENYYAECKNTLLKMNFVNIELRIDFGGKFRMIKGEFIK